MAYCSQADVEIAAGGARALVELCDLDGARSGTVNATVLAAAIADADALIDSYVAKQRAVPLNPVPAVVRRVSAEETVHALRCRRQIVGEYEDQRHENNVRWLEGVAKGMITLGVDPQPAKSALVAPAVVTVDDSEREITAFNTRGIW
jgi:phage gp36-like protein